MTPLRRLLTHSAIYFASNVAMRAMTVVLAPIYTRRLDPVEYGELAWANTLGALLTLVASLALPAALGRFSPSAEPRDRAELTGAALIGSGAAALVCGIAGVLALPHARYMHWVLWTSALSFGQGLAVQSFAARERPRAASALNLAAVAAWLGGSLYFVVWRDQGLEGALRGGFVATALTCAISLGALVRDTGVRFSAAVAKRNLAFSLPLVPHLLSNWGLSISDRLLIERYAGKAALAPYTIAYFFNLACVMATSALAQALSPIFVREADAARVEGTLPALGDACVATSAAAGVVLCLLAPPLIPLLAPGPAYGDALRYVPWVVLGGFFQGIYFVLSQGSWYSTRTAPVGAVTAAAAVVNLGMNVWLLPRYGAIAAAWNTALAYGVLALLHGLLARRLYPVRWHYGRWLAILALGASAVALRWSCAS